MEECYFSALLRHKSEINVFFQSVQNFTKESNYILIFHLGAEERFSLEMSNKGVEEADLKLKVGFMCFLKNILKYVTLNAFQADYATSI